MSQNDNINGWKEDLLKGDIHTLARTITLIESQRKSDQDKKIQLLQSIQSIRVPSVKIGVTGSPGVGKSTFLNTFISLLSDTSHKIAVLTIDPSSNQTGGSILGDKLRMKDLLHKKNVYIRPSPSKGVLGGMNLTTWETIQLCEAAGYDYIFVETVGVGQSEMEVQYLVNEVWYLTMAQSGDEIQGIKRGILEVVDRIIVTKTDLDPFAAKKTKVQLMQSVAPHSLKETSIGFYEVSALQPTSLKDLFKDFKNIPPRSLTKTQKTFWFEKGLKETLIKYLESNKSLCQMRDKFLNQINNGSLDYWTAMNEIKKELEKIWGK